VKPPQHSTCDGAKRPLNEVAYWAQALPCLHARSAPRACRVPNLVAERWPISKGFLVPLSAKMAGTWPNMEDEATPYDEVGRQRGTIHSFDLPRVIGLLGSIAGWPFGKLGQTSTDFPLKT
jgi:hypothetical protein